MLAMAIWFKRLAWFMVNGEKEEKTYLLLLLLLLRKLVFCGNDKEVQLPPFTDCNCFHDCFHGCPFLSTKFTMG